MPQLPDPSDEENIREALATLIEQAHHNDVTVEGAWKCTIGDRDDSLDWDIRISRVEYNGDDRNDDD